MYKFACLDRDDEGDTIFFFVSLEGIYEQRERYLLCIITTIIVIIFF